MHVFAAFACKRCRHGLQGIAESHSELYLACSRSGILQGYGLYSAEFSFTTPPLAGQPGPVTVRATQHHRLRTHPCSS